MLTQKFTSFTFILLLCLGGLVTIAIGVPTLYATYFETHNLNQHIIWQHTLLDDVELIQQSHNGKTIAISTGNEPSTLTILDSQTGQQLWAFSPSGLASENRTITCFSLSSNGDYIALGTTGGSIFLFHRSSNDFVQHWQVNASVNSILLSERGTFITIAFANHIYFLSRLDATPLWGGTFVNPSERILNATIDNTGHHIAVSTSTNEVYFIRTGDGEVLWTHQLSENTKSLHFNTEGDLILVITPSSCILFSITGEIKRLYSITPTLYAFSGFGNCFAITFNQTIYLYSLDLATSFRNQTYDNHLPTSLALTYDGRFLLLGTNEGRLYTLNSQNLDLLWTLWLGTPIVYLLTSNLGDTFIAVTPNALCALKISSITGFFLNILPIAVVGIFSMCIAILTYLLIRAKRPRLLVSEESDTKPKQ